MTDESGTTARPARGPRRWYAANRVLVWMCVLIGVNQLGFGAIVPVVPLYARSFDVPQAAIGLTIAVYGLARLLLNVPGGQIADHFGRRHALVTGCLVTAGGNLLCGLAQDYLPFLAARFVAGAGSAVVLTAGQIVLADISPREKRGRIMSIYSGVFLFAVGLGPLPGGVLAEYVSLAAPFFAFAVLSSAAAAVAWFRVPETRGLRSASTTVALPTTRLGAQLRTMARQPGFLLVCAVSFGSAFSRTGGLFNLIPILGTERLALGVDQIGVGLAVMSVVSIVLVYPSGMLVDYLGRKAVIVPATFLTGLSFPIFLLVPSYAGFLAGCIAWAIATGVSSSAPAAYAADSAPPGMNAAAMGAYRTIADLGYVVGPLLLGSIADLFGLEAALFATTALMILTAVLFGLFAPETHRGRVAKSSGP